MAGSDFGVKCVSFEDAFGLLGVGVELWEDTSSEVSLQSVSCSTSKLLPWGIFCSTSKVVLLGIRGKISWGMRGEIAWSASKVLSWELRGRATQELLDSWIDGALLGRSPVTPVSVPYLPELLECGSRGKGIN